MTTVRINPFYAARKQSAIGRRRQANASLGTTKLVIDNATLYRADCFEVLPRLHDIGAVITDPPYGIGFSYRSYDDCAGQASFHDDPANSRAGSSHQ